MATAASSVNTGTLGNMSVPKIAIDPHWVAQTLIPYLRHAFSKSLRRNHDITPCIERALNFCKTKPDFPSDGDDLLFERVFLAIEHRLKDQPAERNGIADNLEPLAKFLIRRAQLKGPYELLGRDRKPSEEWKQYETRRRASLASHRARIMNERAKAPRVYQQTSALRSTPTPRPLPLYQHSRISPRTSPIDHLIDPRLFYARPGQYTSPGLSGTLTVAEDQHHRSKNLEFQQFLAMCPAHEPWWQHQHMLTQAAATLYSMARTDAQGYQDQGLPSQNLPMRGSGYNGSVPGQSQPPPMVHLNTGQPWNGISSSRQVSTQQSGVVQHELQKLAPTGPPSLESLVRDSMYNQIMSGRKPSQIVIPPPSHILADFANYAKMYSAPSQQTQQMPAPTAHMYTPPQTTQGPPKPVHQPVQQHTQRMEPRPTPIPYLLPSQRMPTHQAAPVTTPAKRKPPPSLPTLARPSSISKPTPQTPRTPATPRMSVPDHATWANLTKAQKIAKILEHDREQKADNPNVITPLDQYFAEHKEYVDKVLAEKAKRSRSKKRREGVGSERDSSPPTLCVPARPTPQDSSLYDGYEPKRKDFTEIAFKVERYTDDPSARYTAPLNQGEAGFQEETIPPPSSGAQVFVNHPGFSNIVSMFPTPRFHGLPEVPVVPSHGENEAGEMG